MADDEHGGKSRIEAVDDGAAGEGVPDFFALLGCHHAASAKIKSAAEGGDDEAVAGTAGGAVKLYHASDASGALTTTEVTARPLTKAGCLLRSTTRPTFSLLLLLIRASV